MMKMMILAPRRSGMTKQEFRDYLTGVHGPLVKSVAEVAAGIRHYHYNFPIAGGQDEAFSHPVAAHLDVVTQGWFDSRAAQHRNMAQPRYLEIIRPDEGKFADEGRAVMHYTHEIEITAGGATDTKMFYLRRRAPGLGRAEFQSRWRRAFTEIVAESAAWSTVVSRCVQNHVLAEDMHPDGESEKFFDVIDELSLLAPGVAGLRDDAMLTGAMASLERELLDGGRTQALLCERVINIA